MRLHAFRLSTRITALMLLIVVAAALALFFIMQAHQREANLSAQGSDLEKHLIVEEIRLNQAIDGLRRDVLFLSNTPPVSGIVRATLNHGYDSRYSNTQKVWEERLQQIFSAFAKTRPDYYKIRYIGVADGGREIVRIDNHDGTIKLTPEDKLQTKGDRGYFTTTLGLREGQVYLSEFDLDQEHGAIWQPRQLVLRAATPVFTPSGEIFGVVVINMDTASLLRGATRALPSGTQTYIASEGGQYLLYPDSLQSNLARSSDKGNIAEDFPFIKATLDPHTNAYLPFQDWVRRAGEYAAARRIHFDPTHPERFLLLMYHIPDAVINKQIAALPVRDITLWLVILLLACVIILLLLRRAFAPLELLTATATRIAAGEKHIPLPKAQGGEIGNLIMAFDAMLGNLSQREKLLQQSERKYRLLVDTIPQKVFYKDLNSVYVSCNKSYADGLKIKPDEIAGKTDYEYFPAELAEKYRAEDKKVIALGNTEDIEEKYIADGQKSWMHTSRLPVYDNSGNITGILGILSDITERKQLEEMSLQMENTRYINIAIETAIAMTHELSQPLTACGNYLSVCLRCMGDKECSREKLTEALRLASEQADRAGKIIANFRSIVGKHRAGRRLVDINILITEVMNLLRVEAKRQDVIVRTALSPLPTLMAHKGEIEQVLRSLFENALEAMQTTAQRELSVTTCINESGHIQVTVGDSGTGIMPARMGTLFEPFLSSKDGRLGMGLPICRTLVERHGGRIWAHSQLGIGTEFYFTLPAEARHE